MTYVSIAGLAHKAINFTTWIQKRVHTYASQFASAAFALLRIVKIGSNVSARTKLTSSVATALTKGDKFVLFGWKCIKFKTFINIIQDVPNIYYNI